MPIIVLLAAALLLGACGRTLKSCAASIIVFGPTMFSFECPPPNFQQHDQDTDTTER